MTTINISDLWRERQAAIAQFEVTDDEDPVEGTAWTRYIAADEAIRAARPTTIAGLAVQMRLLDLGELEIVAHGRISTVRSPGKPRPTCALIWWTTKLSSVCAPPKSADCMPEV